MLRFSCLSASAARALTTFWLSTRAMTAPPSTARRRTLTAASGRPSTCRGWEECRQAGVHLWWALNLNLCNPHQCSSAQPSTAKRSHFTKNSSSKNTFYRRNVPTTTSLRNIIRLWQCEQARGLFSTLQQHFVCQTDVAAQHFKVQNVKAIC